MYKILADDTLIYDSTIEDYKIGKGSITLETNKSGSFVFSLYPDHFYYDKFVRLKTVITVYKSDRIVFRGRILNDVSDYWNNKVITCEGELGFLQDSIIRPFTFTGTPEELFAKFVEEHNSQVDEFKRFKVGTVTVEDPNNYINRSNSEYESALSNLNSRLIEDSLGGYFYITHGEDGRDKIPTLNYLSDFTKISSQTIEFGSNLKNYTKTIKAEDIATAIIPLGATLDDGNSDTEDPKLTIASINNGVDYVYSETGVALYGWIFKTVSWDDVTEASNLKAKAEAYLESVIKQNITIELNAIDLHLLDKSRESFNVCDYVHVTSEPHNFDSVLLCNKQTLDLLKPENDSLVLGVTYSTFTENNNKIVPSILSVTYGQKSKTDATIKAIKNSVDKSLEYRPLILAQGEITIETTSDDPVYIPLQANCMYLLMTSEITISSGAVYGCSVQRIHTSINPSTNKGVISRASISASSNGGITLADVNSDTQFGITLKPNAVTRKVIYSLIKIKTLNNIDVIP
jgi:phage minor structural protein